MSNTVFACDLSLDLGYGRNMPPAFWRWCEKRGLQPRHGTLGFDPRHVSNALRGLPIEGDEDLDDEDLD